MPIVTTLDGEGRAKKGEEGCNESKVDLVGATILHVWDADLLHARDLFVSYSALRRSSMVQLDPLIFRLSCPAMRIKPDSLRTITMHLYAGADPRGHPCYT